MTRPGFQFPVCPYQLCDSAGGGGVTSLAGSPLPNGENTSGSVPGFLLKVILPAEREWEGRRAGCARSAVAGQHCVFYRAPGTLVEEILKCQSRHPFSLEWMTSTALFFLSK